MKVTFAKTLKSKLLKYYIYFKCWHLLMFYHKSNKILDRFEMEREKRVCHKKTPLKNGQKL